jgi:hypothetical protein
MSSGQRYKDRACRVRGLFRRTLLSVFTGRGLTSAGDFVLGTITLLS